MFTRVQDTLAQGTLSDRPLGSRWQTEDEDDGEQVNEFYAENKLYRDPSYIILQITYTFMGTVGMGKWRGR